MPGFGKRMEDDQVPEWSTEYVPYKAMMKQLDKLVARMAAEEQDRHLQENVATTGGGAPKPTLRGVANDSKMVRKISNPDLAGMVA